MRKVLFGVLLLGLFSVQIFAQQSVFKDIDVFSLEYASSPQISPDGKTIVYLRNGYDIMKDGSTRSLWKVDIKGEHHQKMIQGEERQSSPEWSPDGTKLAFVSSKGEGAEIYVYWMDSGKSARLTQLEKSPSGLSWSPDGQYIAFSMVVPEKPTVLVSPPKAPKGAKWADKPRVTTRLRHEADGSGYIDPGYRHLFIIPSDGGTPRQLTSGNFHHGGTPQWTNDGNNLVFSSNRNEDWEYEFRNSEIYKLNIATQEIVALTNRNGPDGNPKISPDGKLIAYLGYDDKVQTYQNTKIHLMNIDGTDKKTIPLNEDISPSQINWNAKGNALYFIYDQNGDTKIGNCTISGKFTKIADQVGGTVIGRPYGGGSYTLSNSDDIVYTKTSVKNPADVCYFSQKSRDFNTLTHLNDDILPFRNLGNVEEFWYESTVDNRKIQGWVVTPPDYDSSKKYPLIVENHGGPISNYGSRFSAEMQLYAAAGYVVFYPNPRGSTGYGEEFANLLFNHYPGNDYDDVMDGVEQLISNNKVYEDSLFVTGGSAGGIMTAWIIGKNNRFTAAAVVKPVMNWISKTLVADNYFYYADYRYPGQPWENMENYWKFSPLSLVGNIKTPTLVMVGTADLRTPISEAKQLYHALKIRRIETALVEVPGAYHNISAKPSQMITKVAHILAWFEKYRE